MQYYKFASAASSADQVVCYNDQVIGPDSDKVFEGSIDDGFVASIIESVGNAENNRSQNTTAECMTKIKRTAKDSFERRRNAMFDAVVDANDRAFENEDKGCTIVSAALKGRKLAVTNLGRGAAFLRHAGKLERLTDEHVEYITVDGTAKKFDSRYIGLNKGDSLNLPVYDDRKLEAGDVLLLCSSAVADAISEEELLELLGAPEPVETRLEELMSRIQASGAKSFSAIIMEVGRNEAVALGSYKGKVLPEIHESPLLAAILAVVFIIVALIIIIVNKNRTPQEVYEPTITPDPYVQQTETPDIWGGQESKQTPDPSQGGQNRTADPGSSTAGGEGSKVTAAPVTGGDASKTSGPTMTPTSTPGYTRPTAAPTPTNTPGYVWPTNPPYPGTPTPPPGIVKPTPTPEPSITPTDEPKPTDTPEPGDSDKPTEEPIVTEGPTPEPIVTEEPTPEPIVTEEPTPEPVVTEEPTPEPIATEEPTPTPEPDLPEEP